MIEDQPIRLYKMLSCLEGMRQVMYLTKILLKNGGEKLGTN